MVVKPLFELLRSGVGNVRYRAKLEETRDVYWERGYGRLVCSTVHSSTEMSFEFGDTAFHRELKNYAELNFTFFLDREV